MTEYHVFESNEEPFNFIGSVVAESMEEAIDKAHEQYGGPIEVRER